MVPYKYLGSPKNGKIRIEKNKGKTKMKEINRDKKVIKKLDFA